MEVADAQVTTPLSGPSEAGAENGHENLVADGLKSQGMDATQRVLTPPTSDDAGKREEVESEGEDEDIGDVEPAEWWDGGIPIFRPVCLS
jgi:hypothetical protein